MGVPTVAVNTHVFARVDKATALAHEAYLRLSGGDRANGKDQAHFCAIAARTMRQMGGHPSRPITTMTL